MQNQKYDAALSLNVFNRPIRGFHEFAAVGYYQMTFTSFVIDVRPQAVSLKDDSSLFSQPINRQSIGPLTIPAG